MKSTLTNITIIGIILILLGGCAGAKYWAFKQKYPQAGVGSFILSGGK